MFEDVLSKISQSKDIDTFAQGVSYPISKRLIGELFSLTDASNIKSLSDVKTNLISEQQAQRFLLSYRSGFKSQIRDMGRIGPMSLLKNTMSYFWRLLLLMLLPMIYSSGNAMDNLNTGIVSLVQGQGWHVWESGLTRYLTQGLFGETIQFLAVIALVSTFVFSRVLGFRFNRWITSGLFGRIKTSIVLTVLFVMLLALFPSNVCVFDWHRYLPTFDMLKHGAVATAASAPTLLALSLLLGLIFNRSLNYPGTYRKLLRMGFSKKLIDAFILKKVSDLYLPEHVAAPWQARGQLQPLGPEALSFSLQFHLAQHRGRLPSEAQLACQHDLWAAFSAIA